MAKMPVTSVCSHSLTSLVSQIHQVCIKFIKIHNQILILMMKLTCEASARLLLGAWYVLVMIRCFYPTCSSLPRVYY